MSVATNERTNQIDLSRCCEPDAEVRAYFRDLNRRLLAQSGLAGPVQILGVTSCQRGAGVSTVASGLAVAAAEAGEHKVLLVDADTGMPSIHRLFGLDQAPGLMNVVQGTQSLEEALQPSSLDNLWVLPAGAVTPGVATVDTQAALANLFSRLSQEFSFVVVDMAPVDQLGDLQGMGAAIHGVVLVIEAERTRPSLARAVTNAFTQARVLGAVLNKRQPSRLSKHSILQHLNK